MKLFAIFGDPVEHSRSPLMHNYVFRELGFDGCYARVHLKDGNRLRETFFKLRLDGANVTVPHKEAAFAACDEVRGFAKKIGVVNTLVNEDGRLIGYNTDAEGFLYAIKPFSAIKTVLVIGAGGTAKALSNRFVDEGFNVTVLNRSTNRLDYFRKMGLSCHIWENMPSTAFDLIVNTTSAGLKDDNLPAPAELLNTLLGSCRFAADVIYGKATPFLQLCTELGITSKDGSDMLLGQGVLANNYFTEGEFTLEAIEIPMKKSFDF